MVVVMKMGASDAEVEGVVEKVQESGGEAFVSRGRFWTIIGLVGDTTRFLELPLESPPGVDRVVRVGRPYKVAALARSLGRFVAEPAASVGESGA